MNTMAANQLESTLLVSIQQYERIYELLQKMEQDVGTADSDELEAFNQSLQELQAQAINTDQAVNGLLHGTKDSAESVQKLVVQREFLLKAIIDLNKNIAARASGVKSLIAHELSALRSGLSAMNGYRQQQNNQGRIINRSS